MDPGVGGDPVVDGNAGIGCGAEIVRDEVGGRFTGLGSVFFFEKPIRKCSPCVIVG